MFAPFFFHPEIGVWPHGGQADHFVTHMPVRPPPQPMRHVAVPGHPTYAAIPIPGSSQAARPIPSSDENTPPPPPPDYPGTAPVQLTNSPAGPPSYKLLPASPETVLLLAPPPRYRSCSCDAESGYACSIERARSKKVSDVLTAILLVLNLVIWSMVIWGYIVGWEPSALNQGFDELSSITFPY